MPSLDEGLIGRLFQKAGAARWDVPREAFAEALEQSAAHAEQSLEADHRDWLRLMREAEWFG